MVLLHAAQNTLKPLNGAIFSTKPAFFTIKILLPSLGATNQTFNVGSIKKGVGRFDYHPKKLEPIFGFEIIVYEIHMHLLSMLSYYSW